MRKDFDDCLELIKNQEIRLFVQKALQKADPYFWTDPCSSSGKYHPPEDQVEGGIIIHSRKVVRVTLALFQFFDIRDQLDKDKVIAAAILHDIKKNGIPWRERTDYKHGPIAAQWLQQFVTKDNREIVTDTIDLVAVHMGRWNQPESTPAIIEGKKCDKKIVMHLIIQLADFWASRKWCSFISNDFTRNEIE